MSLQDPAGGQLCPRVTNKPLIAAALQSLQKLFLPSSQPTQISDSQLPISDSQLVVWELLVYNTVYECLPVNDRINFNPEILATELQL